MSKYLDTVRSLRPEHLYVFDLDRATLDGGTVSDLGFNPINGVITEDTGFAELEVGPSIIDNLEYSVRFNVLHDRSVNNPDNYASFVTVPGAAQNYTGDEPYSNWAIEALVKIPGHNRARFDDSTELANTEGLVFERVDDFNRKVVFRVNTTDGVVTVAESANIPNGSIVHIFIVKSLDTYALFVDGDRAGNLEVTNFVPFATNDFYIGGQDSQVHSDAIYGLFATYDKGIQEEQVRKNYQRSLTSRQYILGVRPLAPQVVIDFSEEPRVSTSEPFLSKLSEGANSEELYEDENGDLQIQPSLLGAGAVTQSKKLKFDTSELTSGVTVELNITTVTDANSSVDVFYSFDDAAYSAFAAGDDGIAELDAKWGGAV